MSTERAGHATLALAVGVIALALMLPNYPGSLSWAALAVVPFELPTIVIALVLARGRAARPMRWLLTAALTVIVALKIADLGSYSAFTRPYNPVLDLHLAAAGWRLLTGAIGVPLAVTALAGVIAAFALIARALFWAAGRIAAVETAPRARAPLGLALVAALALVAVDVARERRSDASAAAFTTRIALGHARAVLAARADLAAFRVAVATDPLADLPPGSALTALRGTDILMIFVESYGRVTIESPRFAPTTTAALDAIEARLAARGLAMRSAWLGSPTIGGQSWLAHATMLSGLRIDNQGRYRALFASPRRTLLDLAQDAGWRSVAVQPAITLAWPEADWFGYDRLLDAAGLGYAGPPFNWVTMPDQFTLAAFERAELEAADRAPVIAEVALISSHAPWTPIPDIVPWDAISDGRIFEAMAAAGPTPEAVWSDPERIRDQFSLAIDYSLRTVGAFAERRAAAGVPVLIVVLGDHQPAPFVSQDDSGRDVPIHIIGAPEVLARLDGWGWSSGLTPGPDAPVWQMEAFRDRFVGAFGPVSGAVCQAGALPATLGC